MKNLLTAYNGNGAFDGELLFIALYERIPCKYEYMVGIEQNQLDESEISPQKIFKFFKHIDVVRTYNTKSIEEKDGQFYEHPVALENPHFLDFIHLENDATFCVAGDNKVVYVRFDRCLVWYDYTKDSLESIKKFTEDIYNSFPLAKVPDNTAKVGLVKVTQDDYYVQFSEINPTHLNIEENYNDDFLPIYEDIKNFLESRGSGLILLYGKIGSGKSTFIRHLCSTFTKDYVIIPNAVASRLGDPEFISFVTSCKDDVFILEDCEQLLTDRADNPWNNAITTILNMADGLLSDIVNIKFICTFNANIDKIDPALLRKGRCFAKYEFGDLKEDKVKSLNDKYHLNLPEIKPMTLAEIFNSEKTDYSENVAKNKIGF